MSIQFNALTLGEVAYIEKVSNCPIQAVPERLTDPTQSMIPLIRALAFIGLRRGGNVEPTAAEIDALTIDQVMAMYDMDETEPDPEPLPAGETA